jgi:acetyl esterase/lipase
LDNITLTWPAEPTGQAVLILPGGAYRSTSAHYEKRGMADWLAARGIASSILDYRVAPHRYPAPLEDARAGLADLRERSRQRCGSGTPVGVWGFSAGGHLAGLLATDESDRPDFALLSYPIVSLEAPDTHRESVRNLLGDQPGPRVLRALSIDHRVDARMPPTFIVHASDDEVVPAAHSVRLHAAVLSAGVAAELHVYGGGGHGAGLQSGTWPSSSWLDLAAHWILDRDMPLPP